jgi:hypothetical protein
MTDTNLEYGHQEVLWERILEPTSAGFANCCSIGTEDMNGRLIIHTCFIVDLCLWETAKKANPENYLDITTSFISL